MLNKKEGELMDSNIQNLLKNASEKYQIPYEYLYTIVMTESKGIPTAQRVSSSEDSRGLFQVNTYAHPDVNGSQLFNPQYSIDYWVPQLKKVYDKGVSHGYVGSNLALYLEKNGERPQWTNSVVASIMKNFNDITNGNNPLTNIPTTLLANNTIKPPTTGKDLTKTGSTTDKIFANVKLYAIDFVLLIFLLFGLYMIFIKKSDTKEVTKE